MSNTDSKAKSYLRISWNVFSSLSFIFFVVVLMGLSFGISVGAGYFASLVKDEPIRSYEDMKKDIYNYEETSELYFANNVYLGNLRSDLDREAVSLKNVSPYVIDALIATEDENFYEHHGVVPKSIIRATLQEFTNSSVKSGGSTLTQQIVKNQILTNEVSFERKAKEIMIALRLEKFFSKDEILEAYLNIAPFGRNSSGRNIAGVQTAAKGIFNVDAKNLNLAQSAYLAGLPQSPSGYTPFTNKGEVKENIEPSLNRMKTVLSRMLSTGKITKSQYNEALKYDIRKNLAKPKASPIQEYPWVAYELEKRAIDKMAYALAKNDGYTEKDLKSNNKLYDEYHMKADRDIRRNGYKIYSTIDKNIYDKMQEIKDNYKYYGNDKFEKVMDPKTGKEKSVLEPVQVGGILIENNTGKIISFIGGRDFEQEQLNHATNAYRSNGSTMKPLLVYGPALELGVIHPGSPIPDVPINIPVGNQTWTPQNYSKGYKGIVTARYALANSYNIPAAYVYKNIFDKKPIQYLEKMGVSSLTEGDSQHLSLSLGALDKGITVEENVNAYTTFANYGKFVDAYMIEKIVSKDGKIVYQNETKPEKVFSPQTSYLAIDMMRDVLKYGTAASLPRQLQFKTDWAGKTGTSQDSHDSWMVATNPNVTFGLWMGYDTQKPLEQSYKGYPIGVRNQKLWAELINATYKINPNLVTKTKDFVMPKEGGIVKSSYCFATGGEPTKLCKSLGLIRTDLFNEQYLPKDADNSFKTIKYITINNKNYKAHDGTPEEFIKESIMFSPEFIKGWAYSGIRNLNQLVPYNSNINAEGLAELSETNGEPTPIQDLTLNDNTLSWGDHPHSDIVGYRIYQSKEPSSKPTKIAHVPSGTLSFKVPDLKAYYQITAVDIDGNVSPLSNQVTGTQLDTEPSESEGTTPNGNDDSTSGEN